MENSIQHIPTRTTWSLADLDAAIRGDGTIGGTTGGVTMRELMASTGLRKDAVTDRLHTLKQAGKLKPGRELREGIDGLMHLTPVYYIEV